MQFHPQKAEEEPLDTERADAASKQEAQNKPTPLPDSSDSSDADSDGKVRTFLQYLYQYHNTFQYILITQLYFIAFLLVNCRAPLQNKLTPSILEVYSKYTSSILEVYFDHKNLYLSSQGCNLYKLSQKCNSYKLLGDTFYNIQTFCLIRNNTCMLSNFQSLFSSKSIDAQ